MNPANNTSIQSAPLSANNIFTNLDALRLSPEVAAIGGTSEVLSHAPARRPNRHEFFRTPVEPEKWFDTGVDELSERTRAMLAMRKR